MRERESSHLLKDVGNVLFVIGILGAIAAISSKDLPLSRGIIVLSSGAVANLGVLFKFINKKAEPKTISLSQTKSLFDYKINISNN